MGKTEKLFTDGEAYERRIGRWSRLIGETFLDWLAVPKGLRWLDVDCGNGVFTAVLIARCSYDGERHPPFGGHAQLRSHAARCQASGIRVMRKRRHTPTEA